MIIGSKTKLKIGEIRNTLTVFAPENNYHGKYFEQPYVVIRETTLEEFIAYTTEMHGPPPKRWKPLLDHWYYEISTD